MEFYCSPDVKTTSPEETKGVEEGEKQETSEKILVSLSFDQEETDVKKSENLLSKNTTTSKLGN